MKWLYRKQRNRLNPIHNAASCISTSAVSSKSCGDLFLALIVLHTFLFVCFKNECFCPIVRIIYFHAVPLSSTSKKNFLNLSCFSCFAFLLRTGWGCMENTRFGGNFIACTILLPYLEWNCGQFIAAAEASRENLGIFTANSSHFRSEDVKSNNAINML